MQATPREMADLAICLTEKIGYEKNKAFEAGRASAAIKKVPGPRPYDQVAPDPVEEAVKQVRAQLFNQISVAEARNAELERIVDSMKNTPQVLSITKGTPITINGIDTTITEDVTWELNISPPVSIQVALQFTMKCGRKTHTLEAEATPPPS